MRTLARGLLCCVAAALALMGPVGCDGSANDETKQQPIVGEAPSPATQQDYMDQMKGAADVKK